MLETEVGAQVAWNAATECKHFAAIGGIPDAPSNCHLNRSGLDGEIQRFSAAWRLR
jgi:hypothetical protein